MLGFVVPCVYNLSPPCQVLARTSPSALPSRWAKWRVNLDCLLSLGFSAAHVCTILRRSSPFLHELDAEADIRGVTAYLWEELGFAKWGKIGQGVEPWREYKYKVVVEAPEVLRRRPEVSRRHRTGGLRGRGRFDRGLT
jgi:hypothetical protein